MINSSFFFMSPDWRIGAYYFCPGRLFIRLSVVNFNLRDNFWIIRNRDFIFGMHTPQMTPFQMTTRPMILWPWLWHWSWKMTFSDLVTKINSNFVFDMHILLMMPFRWHHGKWPCDLDFDLEANTSFWWLCCYETLMLMMLFMSL